jgi:hypothetical protein
LETLLERKRALTEVVSARSSGGRLLSAVATLERSFEYAL